MNTDMLMLDLAEANKHLENSLAEQRRLRDRSIECRALAAEAETIYERERRLCDAAVAHHMAEGMEATIHEQRQQVRALSAAIEGVSQWA